MWFLIPQTVFPPSPPTLKEKLKKKKKRIKNENRKNWHLHKPITKKKHTPPSSQCILKRNICVRSPSSKCILKACILFYYWIYGTILFQCLNHIWITCMKKFFYFNALISFCLVFHRYYAWNRREGLCNPYWLKDSCLKLPLQTLQCVE